MVLPPISEERRYVASLIPNAQFVELPGEDHLPFVSDQDGLLGEIEKPDKMPFEAVAGAGRA